MGIGEEIVFFFILTPVWAGGNYYGPFKFWKLPAQLPSIDFSQSFTPTPWGLSHLNLLVNQIAGNGTLLETSFEY